MESKHLAVAWTLLRILRMKVTPVYLMTNAWARRQSVALFYRSPFPEIGPL